MIEFNYPLVKEFTIKKLLVPYIFFQLIFVVFFNVVYEPFFEMRTFRNVYMEYP